MQCLRKRFAIPGVTGFALVLASCAPSTPLVVMQGPSARAPDVLTRACDGPVVLPQGGLGAGQVARLWGQDRVNLATCRGRHRALGAHVRAQEAADRDVVHPPFSMGERGSGL